MQNQGITLNEIKTSDSRTAFNSFKLSKMPTVKVIAVSLKHSGSANDAIIYKTSWPHLQSFFCTFTYSSLEHVSGLSIR